MATLALPSPRILSTRINNGTINTRGRNYIGNVPGPGLIMWIVYNTNQVPGNRHVWNIYYSTVKLQDQADQTATTPYEGIPLFNTEVSFRGVIGLELPTSSNPILLEPKAPLPAGSYHLHFCLGNGAGNLGECQIVVGFQPVPELG